MYRCVILCMMLLLTTAAFATDPPTNAGHAKPPVWVKPPVEWFDNRAVTPDPNAQAGPLIVAGYGSGLTSASAGPQPLPSGGTALPPSDTAAPSIPLAGSDRYRLRIAPTAVSNGAPALLYSWPESLTNSESEPVITANDISGTTYQVAAFHHQTTYNGHFNNWIHASYATTANQSAFSPSSPTLLYVPSGYYFDTDPYLAQNSYDNGIAPRRIYVTGCLDSLDANANAVAPSAVRVWYSDNGGQSWSGGWNIASRDTGQIFDRETAAVSDYSGTRGYFYDAYVDTTGSWSIYITSSTNGVTPFCNAVPPIRCYSPQLTTALVSSRDVPMNPQIVINPTTGRLYVLWWTEGTPYGNTAIRMRRSSDWQVTNLEVDGAGNPVEYTIANGFNSSGILHSGIKALTAISAKYNSMTGNIDLAWHGFDATSNADAIYFMSFNPDTVTSSNTPMPYSRIDAAGDQYDPVLDHDPYGNTLVSYYSNQDDPANINYYHYGFAVARYGYIYAPYKLDSATTPHHYWPGDYSGNFFWSARDANGARFFLIDAIENPVGSGTLDTRWMGVQ